VQGESIIESMVILKGDASLFIPQRDKGGTKATLHFSLPLLQMSEKGSVPFIEKTHALR
jgi:hypothetical protein